MEDGSEWSFLGASRSAFDDRRRHFPARGAVLSGGQHGDEIATHSRKIAVRSHKIAVRRDKIAVRRDEIATRRRKIALRSDKMAGACPVASLRLDRFPDARPR